MKLATWNVHRLTRTTSVPCGDRLTNRYNLWA